MKNLLFFFLLLINQSALIAQDSCQCCRNDFVLQPPPKNLNFPRIKDSLNFDSDVEQLLKAKKSYGFEFAFFTLKINKKGQVKGLKQPNISSFSIEDKLFLRLLADKVKVMKWYPANVVQKHKIQYINSSVSLVLSVQSQDITIYFEEDEYGKEVFLKDYKMDK